MVHCRGCDDPVGRIAGRDDHARLGQVYQQFGWTRWAAHERGLAAASTTNAERRSTSGHTWPPIINLSEANGYFFATGRAELQRAVVIPAYLIGALASFWVIERVAGSWQFDLGDCAARSLRRCCRR